MSRRLVSSAVRAARWRASATSSASCVAAGCASRSFCSAKVVASNSRVRCCTAAVAWTAFLFQVGPAGLLDAANLFQVFGGEAHLTRHGTQLARQQPQLRLLDGNLVRGPLPVIGYRGQGGALGLFRPLGGLDPPGGCRLVRHLGGPGRFFQAPHRAARLFGCLAQAHQFTLAHAVGGFHRRDLDAAGLRIASPVVDHQDRIRAVCHRAPSMSLSKPRGWLTARRARCLCQPSRAGCLRSKWPIGSACAPPGRSRPWRSRLARRPVCRRRSIDRSSHAPQRARC
jgi:hypothetical protein